MGLEKIIPGDLDAISLKLNSAAAGGHGMLPPPAGSSRRLMRLNFSQAHLQSRLQREESAVPREHFT
ncbi:hypothetical protein [Methanothermobacter sp.]|uniref:hypothetical protein n=1 Tax=Methanothermobacter sp. TaxID=1884223 RepID=UPI003C76358E